MKRQMLLILFVTLSFLCGCDKSVHDYPDADDIPTEVILNLKYESEMPLYAEIPYVTKADGLLIRYVVNIYDISERKAGKEEYRQVWLEKNAEEGLSGEIVLSLLPGIYQFRVWTDFGQFYDVSDFREVSLSGEHSGCTDARDAFCGVAEAKIRPGERNVVSVMSERPLAKFKFISSGVESFLEKEQMKSGDGKGLSSIEDLVVRFRYAGFYPISFNLFSDEPADAVGNVSFMSNVSWLSESEAELGFDYVFVSTEGTSVPVAIEIFNRSGDCIASSGIINVPVRRNRLTIVKGDFLSSKAAGNIGVDPSYDGEYNMEIKYH